MNQQPKQPTPLEALEFLNQVTGQVNADRNTHINIQAAVELIKQALASVSQPKENIAAE